MVAELAAPARALLFEPDRPPDIEPNINSPARALGWSRSFVEYKRADWVRNHGDDAYGALVQEIVVRYVLHGVERARLAREYAISERQIQAYVTPKPTHRQPTARYYLQPVWRALGRLGLTPGRLTIEKRLGVAAHLSTLAADVLYLLDADQQSRERELCAALRLLATVPPAREEAPHAAAARSPGVAAPRSKEAYRSKAYADRVAVAHPEDAGPCRSCARGGQIGAYHCDVTPGHWHVGHRYNRRARKGAPRGR